jgi:hypothetical protein
MSVLSKINIVDPTFVADQYRSSLYDISDEIVGWVKSKLVSGTTVILTSGSFRFDIDAIYLEPKYLSSYRLNWHQNTMFVNHENNTLIEYTLKKINPANILILNTGIFIQYRNWTSIDADIKRLKQFTSQIIVTIPSDRFDFNRLRYTNQTIAEKLNATTMKDTLLIYH